MFKNISIELKLHFLAVSHPQISVNRNWNIGVIFFKIKRGGGKKAQMKFPIEKVTEWYHWATFPPNNTCHQFGFPNSTSYMYFVAVVEIK